MNKLPGLEEIGFGDAFRRELIDLIEKSSIFDDLHPEELSHLSEYIHAYRALTGIRLYKEGERNSHLCLLVEGRLEVHKEVKPGTVKKLADIRPGRVIGEMSVIDGYNNSASVLVAEPSVLLLLTRQNLERLSSEYPALGVKLLWKLATGLSQRLRQTTGRLVNYL
ncbi:MAG: cyclic nucleotide-binding domain-containing protein [Gammaproteobacteria bacterium]|nr:cyclic nucleotide-binding domain-containing protein [Gammaproteobacteria bacterium]